MPIHLPPHGVADRIQWKHGRAAPMEFVLHSDVNGKPGTGKHMERMQEAVQAKLDTRIAFIDLPADEELLTKDPDTDPRLLDRVWWGDADGKKVAVPTHLISRAMVVIVKSWNGEKYHCRAKSPMVP